MGSITKYSEYATEQEAREAGESFLEHFPPQAYESSYRVWQIGGSGKWVCQTMRWSSCD